MGYLFTSESVSEGHPDKVADQISDAVLDKLLAFDPSSKVACETLVTTGQVVLAGEVKTKAYVDLQRIAREVLTVSAIPRANICSKETRAAYSLPFTNKVRTLTVAWNARPYESRGRRPGNDVWLCYQ